MLFFFCSDCNLYHSTMRISLIILPLLTILQNNKCTIVVEAAASFDPTIFCGIAESDGSEICATVEFTSPSPAYNLLPNGTEVNEYLGGWSTRFTYYDNEMVENGTNTMDVDVVPASNGVDITVTLSDDYICKTTVNNNGIEMDCASCRYCGVIDNNEYRYEVDCTNLSVDNDDDIMVTFTRALTCDESILPVFFPLEKKQNDEVLPADDESILPQVKSAANSLTGPFLLTVIIVISFTYYSIWK